MKPSEWCDMMFENTGDINYLEMANNYREKGL